MKKVLFLLFTIALASCGGESAIKSQEKIDLLIKSGKDKVALADMIKKHYLKFKEDSNNAPNLYELAKYYQVEKQQLDSAKYYTQKVFTDFKNHKVAPAAMLFYATLNADFDERVHWYNQCHKNYPLTKSGENALLAMAIDYENQGQKEKALDNYGKYLATYPNGIYRQDVESSIKNINTPIEDLIKQFEAAQNKPQ